MPSMPTALDEIQALFWTAWQAGSPPYGAGGSAVVDVRWPNDDEEAEPTQGLPWARVTIRHAGGDQYSLGPPGNRLFEHYGWVGIQIFVPLGRGLAVARALAMIAKNAFEGATTPSGVWFRKCHVQEVGKDPAGTWDQTNVMCEFVYDEQR